MDSLRFASPAAIPHAWIIASPSQEEALAAAREIASAAVCLEKQNVPCGVCRGCRKARAGTHPDIITVQRQTDKNGSLRRELTVAQIRELSLDAQVLPGEADRKAYIIEEAELLNLNAQNAALKLLEEPPPTVVFLLCVRNPLLLLETIRSRCSLLTLGGEEDGTDADADALARSYVSAVCSGRPEAVWLWIAKNEIGKLDGTAAFVDAAMQRVADCICGRADAGALSLEQLTELCRLLDRCTVYLKSNVNAKHIFSLLAAESVRIGEQT